MSSLTFDIPQADTLPVLRQCPPLKSGEFLAISDDAKTIIRITKSGNGLFVHKEPGMTAIRHLFDASGVLFIIKKWDKEAHLPWRIHQNDLPANCEKDHPLRRSFSLTFAGAEMIPCMFSPAVVKSIVALNLILSHEKTLFFSIPGGYIPNVFNKGVFKEVAPYIAATHQNSRN